MNKKQQLTIIFALALVFSATQTQSFSYVNAANPAPPLSMPQEYLNYTITVENGTLWAKIDGVYPMHMANANGTNQLPMIYPTPPNTTNMHMYLDGAELAWSNYSDIDPAARHYTDIGNWSMIYSVISPAASDFVLTIHYEHPVQVINGTYTFLYDLNITPYLSADSPKSTAHFNIRVETSNSGVNVHTTGFNGTWNPINYNATRENNAKVLKFDIVSEYNKPLEGDITVALIDVHIPELPPWIILPLLMFAAALTVAIFSRKHVKKNRELNP